jgi:putative glutamine amidotransferase
MERALFSIAVLEQNKSALGICRGIQFFNAVLGGTLYQELSTQFTKSTLSHSSLLRFSAKSYKNLQVQQADGQQSLYNKPAHQVRIEPESPLHELQGTDTLAANSCHHQGIAELSPELIPMAAAIDDLVEAVRMKDRSFVWAVQWYPEMTLCEESSRKLFGVFVNTCRQEQR